jgi:xeroderma pigmentosum group C-complementing protein
VIGGSALQRRRNEHLDIDMAPSRGKGKAREVPVTAPRRSTRSRKNANVANATPDVYDDMVAEAIAAEPVEIASRPLKRRKVSREPVTPIKPTARRNVPPSSASEAARSSPAKQTNESYESDVIDGDKLQQTAEYSSESEESDFAFEDVDMGQNTAASSVAVDDPKDDDEIQDVTISQAPSNPTKKPAVNRRRPATALEKAFRLRVHKIHFLTLLGHCMYANSRCNNSTVQKIMRKLVDKRMRSYLNPKTDDTQFQRNRSFTDGLEQAKAAFKAEFRITTSGMARPRWQVEGDDEEPAAGEAMDLADFATAARDLAGSQDTGNQLFCAMLRSAGVETRLVCSLQTLPFANAPSKTSTPVRKKKPAVFAIASDTDPNMSDASASDTSIGGNIPSVRRRLGQPSFATSPKVPSRPTEKQKPIRTLSYPVYWVEAFNAAHQKWVPVDPMATNTVAKPAKIEPPGSYDLNQMMYAIAFEEDGVARDVTRRYAKAFNAKTRRQRVESSGEDGAKWLKAALRLFRRRQRLDRDQVEDSELASKEAREGLPSNVLDFKGHPYYALERHLRRHEVLHPRREVGKVNAGTAAKPRMEPVFRRQDVLSCKSADKWYRLGREVKRGEQPLKQVPARISRRNDLEDDGHDTEPSTTGLYSIHQTQVYVPPPVVRGRITKNAFGNLDVYVPSMVPLGGIHIRHPLTQQAARALKTDFADAVIGFKFQGRQGTAVIEGAVVPEEHSAAVKTVIEGLEYEALEEESLARSLTALRLWSRFMKGLRIAERVASYSDAYTTKDFEGKEISEADFARGAVSDSTDLHDPTMPTAGRYTLDELSRPSKPTRKTKKKKAEESQDEHVGDEEPRPSARRNGRKRKIVVDDEDEVYMPDADGGGSGFLPEDAQEVEETGGGFVHAAHEEGSDDEGDALGTQRDEEYGGGGFVHEGGDAGEVSGGFLPVDGSDEAAGGFLREDGADEVGGGFLPEEGVNDTGGGFTTEEAENENEATDELFADEAMSDADVGKSASLEMNNINKGSELPPTKSNITPIGNTSAEGDIEAIGADIPITQSTTTTKTTDPDHDAASLDRTSANDDQDSDRDSLLSHDPEDEDAEPDWLESD